ncbi:MAG: NusG antitermination factor [Deltaproteobacteria bacterium]|nr:NusG antitermination factor [Deltaproteobacteria bacterium]
MMDTALDLDDVNNRYGAAWYVLRTQPHRERVAEQFLAERNVASYLPQMARWPGPVLGAAIRPIFPGYLFVFTVLAEAAVRIMRTPGVREFVRFGGEPASVDEAVIAFLRAREGPDGLIRCDQGVRENAEVRIVQGPFRGLTAIVEERLPTRQRIRVLMEILQRTTRVELPERWVRQA